MDSPLMPRPETLTKDQWAVVDDFHRLFYGRLSHWLGYPLLKTPLDLFVYQELIAMTRPQTIIECGTGGGGSALFFASILALLGKGGQVISIDVNADVPAFYRWALPDVPEGVYPATRPEAPGIHYLTANTVAPSTLRKVKALQQGRTMVVLDSTHTAEHVFDECELYGPLVTPGCFLVIEDINIAGHPVWTDWPDGGPYEACDRFLQEHPEFRWDPSPAGRYLMTYHAWLQRRPDQEGS